VWRGFLATGSGAMLGREGPPTFETKAGCGGRHGGTDGDLPPTPPAPARESARYWPMNIKGVQIYGRWIKGGTVWRESRFRREPACPPKGNRQSGSHAPM
jgi:hypothetical protein